MTLENLQAFEINVCNDKVANNNYFGEDAHCDGGIFTKEMNETSYCQQDVNKSGVWCFRSDRLECKVYVVFVVNVLE